MNVKYIVILSERKVLDLQSKIWHNIILEGGSQILTDASSVLAVVEHSECCFLPDLSMIELAKRLYAKEND